MTAFVLIRSLVEKFWNEGYTEMNFLKGEVRLNGTNQERSG